MMLMMISMMSQKSNQQEVSAKASSQREENPMNGFLMANLMKQMASSNSNDDSNDDSGDDYDYDYDNDDYDYDYEDDQEEEPPNPMEAMIKQMVQQKLIAMHQQPQTTMDDDLAPSPVEIPVEESPVQVSKPRVEIAQRPAQPAHKEPSSERVSYRSAP
jgi:hypothetical protein